MEPIEIRKVGRPKNFGSQPRIINSYVPAEVRNRVESRAERLHLSISSYILGLIKKDLEAEARSYDNGKT